MIRRSPRSATVDRRDGIDGISSTTVHYTEEEERSRIPTWHGPARARLVHTRRAICVAPCTNTRPTPCAFHARADGNAGSQ
jgi:hypothetical protein